MDAVFPLIVLSLTIINAAAETTCCPDAWLSYKGSCYLFYDEMKMDWYEAQQYCKAKTRSSDYVTLVATETANENLFIKYYVNKLYNQYNEHRNSTAFWMGASDENIEGIWKWVDKDEELKYNAWDASSGQPNQAPGNHDDCLALSGNYDFTWRDAVCQERVGYPICEKQGERGPTSNYVG